ncbi:DUF488 domain-containing protein [Rhodothermus marinus]|uniref:DUF488 domain-containing protein n=1 Tax=Rhodothermus marinus TaxID=29549 RepID=UPI0012BA40F6|nr:DUF488 domain-containing protein [Rhodothermus marinus]BBM69631.1 hypothetical protein RmaAA213_14770 [Rhodothermus marinus]BBM72613.1 hypothetical protein RmaAA338_14780 [Rhodothermus marinus]
MIEQIFTIGVYGRDEDSFFDTLQQNKIDTFCDIRQRRGVRGREYKFVNKNYLCQKLDKLGIRYVYLKELAPPREVRAIQRAVDQKKSILKRQRTLLSHAFIEAYKQACLSKISPVDIFAKLPVDSKRIVFFCVEKDPRACHRSILTDWIEQKENIPVVHL